MLNSRASLPSAAPMMLTKTAIYLPGLCRTGRLHPTPAPLPRAGFGGQRVPHSQGYRGGFPGPVAGRPMCPPANVLSGDRLVLVCLWLALCLWQLSRPNPASASWLAPSLSWDSPGLKMPWLTEAKSLAFGWRWGGLSGNGPWASPSSCLITHSLLTSPFQLVNLDKNLVLQGEENWAFNTSPLFSQSC